MIKFLKSSIIFLTVYNLMKIRKYFAPSLKFHSSLVSEKLKLGQNHFGQLGVFAISPIIKGEIITVLIGKVFKEEYLLTLTPPTETLSIINF